MRAVRQNLGYEENDTTIDDTINKMKADNILDCVCNWNGLIHWGDTIKEWIEDIYKVKL
jgi:hypothetical protein